MEMPETAKAMPSRSGQRPRFTADTIPIRSPNTKAHAIAATVSRSVGPKRSATSSITGRCERIEIPKSPVTVFFTKSTNCSGNGRSSPRRSRTICTVSSSASGPAASCAGSPGSRCTKKKTHTVTRNMVGTSPRSLNTK